MRIADSARPSSRNPQSEIRIAMTLAWLDWLLMFVYFGGLLADREAARRGAAVAAAAGRARRARASGACEMAPRSARLLKGVA
jgi:hypothetical protein